MGFMGGREKGLDMAAKAQVSPAQVGRNLRQQVGFVGLTRASVGSIIGSGWLFGSLYAVKIAGPTPVLSWISGAVALMILACRVGYR
jgi:amino acid transporter